jgi:hypothetical protein
MQMRVERRFADGFALLFAWTHSKLIDNVGDFGSFLGSGGFTNANCFPCDRSLSYYDIPDVVRLSLRYELPFGVGKSHLSRGVLARVLGGWATAMFYSWDNGTPVQVTTSVNDSNSFGGLPASGRHRRASPARREETRRRCALVQPSGIPESAAVYIRECQSEPAGRARARFPELRHTDRKANQLYRPIRARLPDGVVQRIQQRGVRGSADEHRLGGFRPHPAVAGEYATTDPVRTPLQLLRLSDSWIVECPISGGSAHRIWAFNQPKRVRLASTLVPFGFMAIESPLKSN